MTNDDPQNRIQSTLPAKMSDKRLTVVLQTGKSAKIIKWKIKTGMVVTAGSVILLYDPYPSIGDAGHQKLKSTSVGTVKKLVAQEGDIIKPGEPLFELEKCTHPTIMKDMCAECGADLRNEDGESNLEAGSIPMVHSIPELKVNAEQALILGKADEERLLSERKLVLLVDLDQTLIHTTNDNIPPNLKDVYHFQLHGAQSPWYHTRLRPGTGKFLIEMSKIYELHICTFGSRQYAHMIALFLDPDQQFFSHRILSRDECFSANCKTANLKALFPCGDSLVCIIDDREDVWSFVPNLIHVKPYHFFQHTGDINAPPGLAKIENDDDGAYDFNCLGDGRKQDDTETSDKGESSVKGTKENEGGTRRKTRERRKEESTTGDEDSRDADLEKFPGAVKVEEQKSTANKTNASADDKTTEASSKKGDEKTTNASLEKENEQTSEAPTEKADEKTTNASLEKENEQTSETPTEKADEKTTNASLEKENEQTSEALTEKADEKPTSASLEKEKKQTSDAPTEKADKKITNASSQKENEQTTERADGETTKPRNPAAEPMAVEEPVEESDKETASVNEKSDKSEYEENNGASMEVNNVDVNLTETDSAKPSQETEEVGQPIETITTNDISRPKRAENDEIDVADADDYLLYLEEILKSIHKEFYVRKDAGESPDLKQIVPEIKARVLKGTSIVFSGLVPNHVQLEYSRAYQVAVSLGASVTQDLIKGTTTHLVAVRPGTAKVNSARRMKNICLVTADWLWTCAERWERVDEKVFPLGKNRAGTRHPPAHLSPEHPPPETQIQPIARTRSPSGRFMDTINPLLSFSSADIADMDQEVEDIFNESESDGETEDASGNAKDGGLRRRRPTRRRPEMESENPSDSDVFQAPKRPRSGDVDGESDPSSSSADSLSGEHPRGWRTHELRRAARGPAGTGTESDPEEDLEESPSSKFRRGEALPSDLDLGEDESQSQGSDEPFDEVDDGDWNMMGAALEREFLS